MDFTIRKGKVKQSNWITVLISALFFIIFAAFFESLLDRPETLFSQQHLRILSTAAIAAVLISIFEFVPDWLVSSRSSAGTKVNFRTVWVGLVFVAGSTLLSLAVGFQPGFVLGLFGALTISGVELTAKADGRRALAIFLVVFLGSHALWFASPLFSANIRELAKMVWFAGLQLTLFGLLPIISDSEGRKVWNWSKTTSIVFLLISFFAFIHFLLQPGYDSSIELFQQNSLVALGILGLVFIVSTLAIWWRYPYRLNRKTTVQERRIAIVTATGSRKYISFAVLGTSTILLALGIIGSTTLQDLRDARTWQDVAQNGLITKENMSILVSKLFDENEEEIIDNIGFGQTLFDAYKNLDEEDLESLSELTLPVGEVQDILLPLVSSYTDWLFFNSSDKPSALSLSSIKQNLIGKTPQIASLMLNSQPSCTNSEAEILQELVNPVQPSIDANVVLSFPLLTVYGMKLTNPNLYTEFVIEELNVTIVDREIDMQTFSLRPPCGAFVGRTLAPSSEVTCYFSSVTNQIGQVNETLEFDTLFVPVDSAEDLKLCRINNSNDDEVYSFFEPKIGNMMGLIADRLPDEVSVEQISNDAQLESTLQTVSTLIRYQPYIWILAISMLLGGSYLLAGLSDVALRATGFSVIFASILAGISAKLLPSFAGDAAETIAQIISTSETEYTELILAIVEAITQTISADAIRLSFYLLGVGLILVVTSTLLTTAKNS